MDVIYGFEEYVQEKASSETVLRNKPKSWRTESLRRVKRFFRTIEIFWTNNKTIFWLCFRMMLRIMLISEAAIYLCR